MLAGITTLSKRWRVNPWDFVASQAIIGAATLPLWIATSNIHLWQTSVGVVAFQGVYIGLLVGVISLVAFQRGVALLGPEI